MSRRAIASGGGMLTSPSPAAARRRSSRVNHATAWSSRSCGCGSPPAYVASKPSMSDAGNGHGCEET